MKDIKGYEGKYGVDKKGQVWSYRTKCFLKPYKLRRGYLVVDLCVNYVVERKLVHRLVAQSFIPNPMGKAQVNHVDGNKENNRVENLEWCTNQENRNHAVENGLWALRGVNSPLSKLTVAQVIELRRLAANDNLSFKKLGEMFGICPQTAFNVVKRRSYKEL